MHVHDIAQTWMTCSFRDSQLNSGRHGPHTQKLQRSANQASSCCVQMVDLRPKICPDEALELPKNLGTSGTRQNNKEHHLVKTLSTTPHNCSGYGIARPPLVEPASPVGSRPQQCRRCGTGKAALHDHDRPVATGRRQLAEPKQLLTSNAGIVQTCATHILHYLCIPWLKRLSFDQTWTAVLTIAS